MKNSLFVFLFLAPLLVGCAKKNFMLDVNAITDVSALQEAISQVSHGIADHTITREQAQDFTKQLQQKYVELTDVTQQNIEIQFEEIQKTFSQESVASYSLPLRARKLGMTEPQGMKLNKVLSKPTYTNNEGYSSTILVYQGSYDFALQQAEIIAKKAKLSVNKAFEKAQMLAQSGDTKYISGLDTNVLTKGIVYTNHELLDMDVKTLLSVSVDQDGTLIIETTKYK